MKRSLFNFQMKCHIHFQSPQNCSEVCNNTGQHQVGFIPVSILWSHSGFCWVNSILFNDKTPYFQEQGWRKGPESPQQREKHRDTFCHLSGQSPWSCRVTPVSLMDKVRRISMPSYLFTDSCISLDTSWRENKMGGSFPSEKCGPGTSPLFTLCLAGIFQHHSQPLFPFTSPLELRFAQLWAGLPQTTFIWSGTIIIWVFFWEISKPEGWEILEDFILLWF